MHPKTKSDANNFGMLRLLFAVLVALAHSFCFVDGSIRREPLFSGFHVLTFGELAAVDFFLISGYLVTKSFLHSKSNAEYLGKQVLESIPALSLHVECRCWWV